MTLCPGCLLWRRHIYGPVFCRGAVITDIVYVPTWLKWLFRMDSSESNGDESDAWTDRVLPGDITMFERHICGRCGDSSFLNAGGFCGDCGVLIDAVTTPCITFKYLLEESSSQRPSLIPSCHTCLKFLKIHGSLSGKSIWGRCFWLGQTTHWHNFVCWHIIPMAWLQTFLTLKIALTVFLVLLWNFQHTKYNLQSCLAYCSGHALPWADSPLTRGIYRSGLEFMGEATTWEEQLALDMLLRDHAVWLGSL